MPEHSPERRRTFVPVLGAGVAAAILAAVAGSRPWVRVAEPDSSSAALAAVGLDGVGEMALAATLSLVVLAAWGVLLVTRGRVRRVVAGLGLVGSLGLCAVTWTGWSQLPDSVSEQLSPGAGSIGTEMTGWFWAAAVAALVSVATTALAVAWCPAWPEMGSRYDAPGAAQDDDVPLEERTNLDLWKQLDEGRDPTA
ncbi:Trp biosynthesis-associated membrane protein [Nocardioides sp. GXQ0305]|uniref:Trp biosynthesis-associated membrane protein n=1 Tax=Nocardioides sp. GXQ0305 TaxID=3423912 RepID=UPI003D7E2E65